jgi:GNAT superfamily N-acetyltransferase
VEYRRLDPGDGQAVAAWLALVAAGAGDSPGDPPPCPTDVAGSLRYPPPGIELADWLAYRGGALVGTLRLAFDADATGARVDRLLVHPSHRRRGVGRGLLALARTESRDRVGLTALVPAAGTAFARAVGATPQDGAYLRMRLDLADGLPAAPPPAPGYRLDAWENHAPDHHVLAAAWLERTLGDDDVAPPDGPVDTSYLRALERMRTGRGRHAYHIGAVHEATGALVGYTNITTIEGHPDHLYQGMTVVHHAHRGHRLGRTLKLTNTANARRDHPAARYMDTTNSATNHPMKALNESMGYVVRDELVPWRLPATVSAAPVSS